MATEDPKGSLSILPSFSQPPNQPESPSNGSPPSPKTSKTPPSAGPGAAASGSLYEPREPMPHDAFPATRTGTSSRDSDDDGPSTADTTALIAVVVVGVALGVGALIRWRVQAKLRPPTRPQAKDIAAPIARIAKRHLDLSWLNADLKDVIEAGVATGAYLDDGPLLEPIYPDAGVPDNLQEAQQ